MTKKESKKIDDLVFDSANVRIHPDKNKKAIRDSIKQFGGGRSILIDADDIIRAGNGTAEAWQETGGKVRVVETDGTELIAVKRTDLKGAEAIAYAIADNRSAELAEWDDELLSTQLKELDGGGFEIESMGFDSDELEQLEDLEGEDQRRIEKQNMYSQKIDSPVYVPTGEKPELSDLFDLSKYKKLIDGIEKSDLPQDISDFLRFSASRHIAFNYELIAEFYAHADSDVQSKMEESALVIIDLGKAIEGEYVQLHEQIINQYKEEYGVDDE
jgi:hypothetical protein